MKPLLVVLIVALAGCFGGTSEPATQPEPEPDPNTPVTPETPAPEAGPVPMLLGFDFMGCRAYQGTLQVPVETARDVVPEAYELSIGTGPDGNHALLHLQWGMCEEMRTQTARVPNATFGHASVAIQSGDGEEHRYLYRMLVQEDILLTLWDTAGYDVYLGAYEDATTTFNAGIQDVQQWRMDHGDYGIFQATTQANTEPQAITFVTDTEAGQLVWTGTEVIRSGSTSAGTIILADNDPFEATLPRQEPLTSQHRILTDVDFVGNDLWLR